MEVLPGPGDQLGVTGSRRNCLLARGHMGETRLRERFAHDRPTTLSAGACSSRNRCGRSVVSSQRRPSRWDRFLQVRGLVVAAMAVGALMTAAVPAAYAST